MQIEIGTEKLCQPLAGGVESMFERETALVDAFSCILSSGSNPFRIKQLAHEFYYQNGRVDVVGLCGKRILYSFEAKLRKWRLALYQAYRNSSFSHYSYVVLPEAVLAPALENKSEFVRRGVGLCAVSRDSLRVAIFAPKKFPLQPWLTNTAVSYISENQHEQAPRV